MKVFAIDGGIDIDCSCCFCCLSIAPSAQLPNKSVWLLQQIGDNPQSRKYLNYVQCVCLLMSYAYRHISFFQLFITTMLNTVQTRFNSVLKDWPYICHVWGIRKVTFKVKIAIIKTRVFFHNVTKMISPC